MHKLWKYADFMPQPLTLKTKPTKKGIAISMCFVLIASGLAIFLLVQYFTQTTTSTAFIGTLHIHIQLTLRCVSHSGCNVTHRYTTGAPCAAAIPFALIKTSVWYNTSELFTAHLCYDAAYNEDGVIVQSAFNIGEQYLVKGKLWIAEVSQAGKAPRNLPGIKDFRARVLQMRKHSDVSDITETKLLDQVWRLQNGENELTDDTCPLPASLPAGWTCGVYLLKPTALFTESITKRANSFIFIWGIWSGLMSIAFAFFRFLQRRKVLPEQLGLGTDLEEGGERVPQQPKLDMYQEPLQGIQLDTHATTITPTALMTTSAINKNPTQYGIDNNHTTNNDSKSSSESLSDGCDANANVE